MLARCNITQFTKTWENTDLVLHRVTNVSIQNSLYPLYVEIIGHWLDMVYLPHPAPRGNFVDHIFIEAQCLARILQHVSPLTMAALMCYSLLHTLPYKIFDN